MKEDAENGIVMKNFDWEPRQSTFKQEYLGEELPILSGQSNEFVSYGDTNMYMSESSLATQDYKQD